MPDVPDVPDLPEPTAKAPKQSEALADRIAGAPISWGVCEVPGWGHQLAPEVVLAQMSDVGLAATEFGPDGFLPDSAADKVTTLREHGLSAVGQFVPLVLHDPDHDPLPGLQTAMVDLVAAEASTVVLAAAASARGLVATLHPHVGTMVETGAETDRVLAGSDIGLCLDTGHLLIGGGDPVRVAREHPDRVAHAHLKDVRLDLARRVQTGDLTYTEAVAAGMYVPLGQGDVDIAAIVGALEDSGYGGWYVLEQDTILPGEPEGEGPVADVEASYFYLLGLAAQHSGVGI